MNLVANFLSRKLSELPSDQKVMRCVGFALILIFQVCFFQGSAIADPECEHWLLRHLKKTPDSSSSSLLAKLRRFETTLGDDQYLTVVGPSGKERHVRVIGYAEVDGTTYPKVLLGEGYSNLLDLGKMKSVRSTPESKDFWTKKTTEVSREFEKRTLHLGDSQYLSVDAPGKDGVYMVRVTGYETLNGETLPVVMHTEGFLRILTPEELASAIISEESRNRWLGTIENGKLVHIRKSVAELPQKRADLIRRAGLDPVLTPFDLNEAKAIRLGRETLKEAPDRDFPGYLLSIGLGDSRISKMAKSLDQKMNVKAVYSKEANTVNHSGGFSKKGVTLSDSYGQPIFRDQEIVNLSVMIEKGRIGSVEIHEIGHAKTNRNLDEGKPDPLGVTYHAPDGKTLPLGQDYGLEANDEFYPRYSSADESRQHASDFRLALRQRPVTEILDDFSKTAEIQASKVYGINLQNFHESMEVAARRLERVKILNLRHSELALHTAQDAYFNLTKRNLIQDSHFSFSLNEGATQARFHIKTDRVQTSIPIVGEAFEQIIRPILISSDTGYLLRLSGNPATLSQLRNHVSSILAQQINMLDHQYRAIEKSEIILAQLRKNPSRLLRLEDYLSNQNTFTRVKSTVRYAPERMETLRWTE